MCEFLARIVNYQTSAFKFSMHHLHNTQSVTSETTDCLLIPLALVFNKLVHFSSRFWLHHIADITLIFSRFLMRGKTPGRWSSGLPQVLDSHGSANEDLRFLNNFLLHDKKCMRFLTRKNGEWLCWPDSAWPGIFVPAIF